LPCRLIHVSDARATIRATHSPARGQIYRRTWSVSCVANRRVRPGQTNPFHRSPHHRLRHRCDGGPHLPTAAGFPALVLASAQICTPAVVDSDAYVQIHRRFRRSRWLPISRLFHAIMRRNASGEANNASVCRTEERNEARDSSERARCRLGSNPVNSSLERLRKSYHGQCQRSLRRVR
jgi:hypothetical protein